MNEERLESRFDVGADASLLVSNIRGQIDVQNGEDNVIVVTATKHCDTGDNENTKINILQDEQGRVTARTEFPDQLPWISWGKPCKVTYRVTIPRSCTINLKGVSSKISVQGIQGSAHIRSVSGDIHLEELNGDLTIRCVSGSVRASKVVGNLKIKMVSGSIKMMDANLDPVRIKTVSGAVTLQTPLGDGPYSFDSVSGRVILVVPEDTACSASLKSISGSIKTSLSGTSTSKSGRRSSLNIGEGGPHIDLKSISGSLYIVTSEDEIHTAKAGNQAAEAVPQPDRMTVLDRIERGEIDVDQAIRELT